MKKILFYTFALLAALLVMRCGSEEFDGTFEATRVPVASADVSAFPATGGSGTIVLATPEPVTATSDQPWCRATVSGKIVTVTVDTTASAFERTALITLSSGEKRNYLPVTQSPVFLYVETDRVGFPAKGGNSTLSLSAPVRFTATSDQAWCHVQVAGEASVAVALDTNWIAADRTAVLTIQAGEKSKRVTVVQREPGLEVSSTRASVPGTGGTVKIPVDYINPVSFAPTDAWLTATVEADSIVLQATTGNPSMQEARVGTVTLTSGVHSETITVVQRPLVVDIAPDPTDPARDAFVNLKNNGSSSRYVATALSDSLQAWWSTLEDFYPTLVPALTLRALRFELPRSSHKHSVILYGVEGTSNKTYYWNSANGFSTPAGGNALCDVMINTPNTSQSGMSSAPYNVIPNHDAYKKLKAFFDQATGLTIIQDGTAFYFRGVADPTSWVKFEPASW
ncbi:MAG: hypothetical protein LBP56_08525 [Odoribacteraceae bacterium]|jgi:hypothetical protein|nr:hypothetical protein [Odoribacteraceae bacterium]